MPLAQITGGSVDELKLIFSFLLSYPLAAILKRIPDSKPWQKNVFIVLVSVFYLIGLFDLWSGVRTIFISSVGAYAIAYYIDGSFMPWIAFFFLMAHMSVSHIYRQAVDDPSIIDVTGAQMVLVIKLSAFCWNIHDGRIKPELLTDQQKSRAIYRIPSYLDYAGYVLFFPSLFAGPAFDYNDYQRYITTSMFDVPPDAQAPPTRKSRRIPRSGTPAAWKAVSGLVWIGMYVQLSTWYNVDRLLSDQYMSYNFLHRVLILYLFGFTIRTKYYGVWALTEGACILSGMGYNGIDPKTQKPLWNRLENVNPWGMETAENSRAYLENWNKNTNSWLRNYVYLRVTPRGKKPGFRASLATFVTSAVWHGFYPGYYLSFVLASFIQTVAKNFRRYIRPFFLSPDGKAATPRKVYYDSLSWLTTQLAFTFTIAPFVILGFSDSVKLWMRVYMYTIVGVAVSLIFFSNYLPIKASLIRKINERNHPHVQRPVHEEPKDLPTLGLPNDPGREIDDALEEIRAEVEVRRRRGSTIVMPTGSELRKMVEEKLGRKLGVQDVAVAADGKVRTE